MPNRAIHFAFASALVLATACATGDSTAEHDAQHPEVADAAGVDTAATAGGAGPAAGPGLLTASDLDAYRRGIAAELAATDSLIAARDRATTADDSSRILTHLSNTTEHGARAAGMSIDRYRELSSRIEDALRARGANALMASTMSGIDTAQLPPDRRAELRTRMREMAAAESTSLAGILEPALFERFRQEASLLDSLRTLRAAKLLNVGR